MTRITRIDTPADSWRAFLSHGVGALTIIPFVTLRAELLALRKALALPASADMPKDLDEEEWGDIITDLTSGLGPVLETDICQSVGRGLGSTQRDALAFQLRRVLRALQHAETCVDATGSATGALLPLAFARRIEVLLGQGVLPLAWVRQIDVLKF